MRAFFEQMEREFRGVVFDDVLIADRYTRLQPGDEISLEARFSRNVPLKIPMVSAAMDTVTESRMAIAMAEHGGLGIIHRNLSPEDQVIEVERVKFYRWGMIAKPITVRGDETIASIEKMCRGHRPEFTFRTFPVLGERGNLLGLLTGRNFRKSANHESRARDVMRPLKDLVTASPAITASEAEDILTKEDKTVLPLVDDDKRFAGMYLLKDIKSTISPDAAFYNVDGNGRFLVGAAIGTGRDAFERAELLAGKADVLVIDVARGNAEVAIKTLRELKKNLRKKVDIVFGNISEADVVDMIVNAGADGIKVGQGPGSICTTQDVTGVGCPQLTAIANVVRELDRLAVTEIPVVADGGIVKSADVIKALAAGASSIMAGNLFAGLDESSGKMIKHRGKLYKAYRGMGSRAAISDALGSRDRYGQAGANPSQIVPEGLDGAVPYKGGLKKVLFEVIGGIRGGMASIGAATIPELWEKAEFRVMSVAGQRESHPHDVEEVHDHWEMEVNPHA